MIVKRLTVEDVQKALPSRKGSVTEELVDVINQASQDPEFQGESLMSTLVTYENLMVSNKASIREYVDAVRFCAYLITMDDSYIEAYKRTFYYRDFVQERMDAEPGSVKYNELSSAASRYRRTNKLVSDILTYSQAPLDIMYMGWRYKALGVLHDVMMNGRHDKDKVAAADKLMQHTASAGNKLEISIGVKDNSMVESLMAQLSVAASTQKQMLEAGARTLDDFGSLSPKEEIIEGEIS